MTDDTTGKPKGRSLWRTDRPEASQTPLDGAVVAKASEATKAKVIAASDSATSPTGFSTKVRTEVLLTRDDTYPPLGTVLVSAEVFRRAMRENRELKARVQQLEAAIADHQAAILVIGEDPDPLCWDQQLWAVLGEEGLDA
jgi:hypothetical protein